MLEREAAQKEVEDPVKTDGGRGAGATAEAPGSVKPPEPLNPGAKGAERILPQKLRFLWKPVADAVRYEIVVEEGTGEKAKVVYRDTHVFNNGVEIALKGRSWLDANHYWRVRALDYDGNARAPFTPPVAVELAEKDPAAPLPTSEFMKMDYVPLYPTYSWVAVLARIRDKCTAHKITPVFATVTSLNPAKIAKLQYAQNPPANWSDEQALVNRWILSQPYCVDVTTILSDGEGKLEDIYTTDGLHPDSVAKRFIGETISNYLRARFPQVVEPILREPRV